MGPQGALCIPIIFLLSYYGFLLPCKSLYLIERVHAAIKSYQGLLRPYFEGVFLRALCWDKGHDGVLGFHRGGIWMFRA